MILRRLNALLDYMNQWKSIVKELYNPLLKQRKTGIHLQSADIKTLKEEQMQFDKHTTMTEIKVDETGKYMKSLTPII